MYKVKKGLLSRKGFPESNKYYKEAHAEADQKEKKKYPKGYRKLKRLDDKIPLGKMIGHNDKKGKVSVSSKVPESLREEVAYHERVESKAIKRLTKEHKHVRRKSARSKK